MPCCKTEVSLSHLFGFAYYVIQVCPSFSFRQQEACDESKMLSETKPGTTEHCEETKTFNITFKLKPEVWEKQRCAASNSKVAELPLLN